MDRFENSYRAELVVHADSNIADEVCIRKPLYSALDDAHELIRVLGTDARQTVAAGGVAQFEEWLGRPSWFTNGTSLSAYDQLPQRISLTDDLILIANIIDNGEAASVITRLYEDFKIPGAPITVPALYNAPTLREALDFFIRTAAVGSPFLKIDHRENGERFSICVDSDLRKGALRDFCSIAILSVACRFVSFFVADNMAKAQIDVEADKASDMVAPLVRLPCQISCGTDGYALHGPVSWLQIENLRSDKAFWNFALERMAVAERDGKKSDIVIRIRAVICAAMQSEARVPRLKQIAAIEGVSERTLVRTLAAQNIKFQQIVEEERRIKAAELIGNASISLSEIARLLGFTDMSSFGRSYRQWFGITPGQARSRRNA
jgi:AraC-like DNA-binding protein